MFIFFLKFYFEVWFLLLRDCNLLLNFGPSCNSKHRLVNESIICDKILSIQNWHVTGFSAFKVQGVEEGRKSLH